MSSPRYQIELLPRRRHDDFCGGDGTWRWVRTLTSIWYMRKLFVCVMNHSVEPIDYTVKVREPMYYVSDLTMKNAIEARNISKCTLPPSPETVMEQCNHLRHVSYHSDSGGQGEGAYVCSRDDESATPPKPRLRNCNRLR